MKFVELDDLLKEKEDAKRSVADKANESEQAEYTGLKDDISEFFSYLGELKTQTEAYREHYISESEQRKEVQEEQVQQDIREEDFEEMVRKKKLSDMGVSLMEQTAPTVKEKWEILKMFPSYQIKVMLAYQMSMT